MIITHKKNKEEILKNIGETNDFFIIGCGGCATKCATGDERSVLEMTEFLQSKNKNVLGNIIIDYTCDIRLAKRDLLKNENFNKAEGIIVLACGAGVQSVGSITDKIIIPALDSSFIGTTERIGKHNKYCSICGECTLIETQGICPKTRCAKGLVNGPCGGFVDGKCETDQTKDCAWVLIYEKMKSNNKEKEFVNKYIKPKISTGE